MSRNKSSPSPKARTSSNLVIPLISPIPIHRLSPALDEFSLRKTPSRGGTASPAPPKGTRKRLTKYHTFDHAVNLLKTSNNITILTGAGISTSVGIPDFRSDKGLYNQLSKDLGITEAEEFFSKDYFVQNTDKFFHYVKRVIPDAVLGADGYFRSTAPAIDSKAVKARVPKFSLTHAFLALLNSKQKLLTNYTQNIDGLELAAGVPRNKFVQCHGSWDTASCMTCGRSSAAKRYLPIVLSGNIPYCKCKLDAVPKPKKNAAKSKSKKRSWDDFDSDHSSDDGTKPPRGLLKPDITFFNERLSKSYGERLDGDRRRIDLLIIIGTSLKVGPVQDMLYQISPKVPQIFISKERFSGALCNLPGVQVDIELLGECDVIIEELCRRAGWAEDLSALCWERGQLQIKVPRLSTSADQKSLEDLLDRNSPNVERIQIDKTSVKIGKPFTEINQAHYDADQLQKCESGGEPPQKLPHRLAATTTSSTVYSSSTFTGTETSHAPRRPSLMSNEGVRMREKSSDLVADVVRKAASPQPIVSIDCNVKIELVEGTAHQWRIAKK